MELDAIFALAVLFFFLVLAGIITNLLIIITTIRSKNLQSCCNVLIAFCAFADCIHVFGQLPKIIPVFLGFVEIRSTTCSLLEIIPNFGLNAGVIIVLLIAIDRFIAVYFQKYYLVKDSQRYLLCHCIVIVVYAAFHYAFAYHYFESRMVICSPPEMYHGTAKKLWGTIAFTVIFLSVIVYYAVWLKLKNTPNLSQDRRTFRSIFAVMCVIILGWLLSMSIFNFVRHGLDLRGRAMYIGVDISGIPVNSAVSLNFFVLYFTSNDYRKAFRHQLRAIPYIGRLFPSEVAPQISTIFETTSTNVVY